MENTMHVPTNLLLTQMFKANWLGLYRSLCVLYGHLLNGWQGDELGCYWGRSRPGFSQQPWYQDRSPPTQDVYTCHVDFMFDDGDQNKNIVCQSDGTWTTLGSSCIPSHCNQLPLDKTMESWSMFYSMNPGKVEMVTDYTQRVRVAVGNGIIYQCSDGKKFESDPTGLNDSLTVSCGKDGNYQYPGTWPLCVSNTTCGSPPPSPSNMDSDLLSDFTYLSGHQISYWCGNELARPFLGGVEQPRSIVSTCHWNKSWSPKPSSYLCKNVFCAETLPDLTSKNLELFLWNSQTWKASATLSGRLLVHQGETFKLQCRDGMAFESDPNGKENHVIVPCQSNLTYGMPANLPLCVQNTTCSDPPSPPSNMNSSLVPTNTYRNGNQIYYMCSSPGEVLAFQNITKPQGKGYSTCLWSKQWDVDPTSFECLVAFCVGSIPDQSSRHFMAKVQISNGSWIEVVDYSRPQTVAVSSALKYVCWDGYAIAENPSGNATEIEILCNGSGKYEFPSDWPQCVQNKTCSDPSQILQSGVQTSYPTSTTINNGGTITIDCSDPTKSLNINGVERSESAMSTCLWDTTWDVDFDQTTCVPTHCYEVIPNKEISHKLRAEFQGTINYSSPLRLPFGESFDYRCLEGLKFAEDPSGTNDSLQVLCTKENGYQFPNSFPKCVANTTCILPANLHSTQKHTDTPLGTEFTNGEIFNFSCSNPAKHLVNIDNPDDVSISISPICQWSTKWSPLPNQYRCKRFACDPPDDPPSGSGLELIGDGNPILLGEVATFRCKEPWVLLSNPDDNGVEVLCDAETEDYAPIQWDDYRCVLSQFCTDPPPDPPIGGYFEKEIPNKDIHPYQCFDYGTWFKQGNFEEIAKVEDTDECQYECQLNDACMFFTYYGDNNTCILNKLLHPTTIYNQSAITGPKSCKLPGPKKDFTQFKITASSTSPRMDPEYALDGKRSKTKFFQSKEELGPWIKIDLLEERLITNVIIHIPRVVEVKSATFSIQFENNSGSIRGSSFRSADSTKYRKYFSFLPTYEGRYLTIRKADFTGVLAIDEVQMIFNERNVMPPLKDCSEMIRWGKKLGSFHGDPTGKLNSANEQQIRCDEEGWTDILIRKREPEASTNFEGVTINQLESGYFSNGEIFMGLQFLYHITNTEDYEMKVILTDQANFTGAAGYDYFQILDNSTFAFKIGNFVEQPNFAGDSFSHYAGVPFSTLDNDKSENKCAKSTGTSGWLLLDEYLKTCTRANLFASQANENNSFGGLTWGSFRGHKHPLSKLWLKVRPKEFNTKVALPFANKAEIDAWYKEALTTEYGTKYTYYCNDGRKLSPQTLYKPLYTCQWNQTWTRNYDMTRHACEWYKCTRPPQVQLLGPDFTVLTWKYDSIGLDIGQTIQVHCKNGKRIAGNLMRRSVDVECGPDNSYIFPNDKITCASTSVCPQPPGKLHTESGPWEGNIELLKPGISYNGHCLGQNAFKGYETAPSCPTVSVRTNLHEKNDPRSNLFKAVLYLKMAGTLAHWQEFNWLNITFAQNVSIRDGIVEGLYPNQIAFPWDLVPGSRAIDSGSELFIERMIHYDVDAKDERLCVYDIDCNYSSSTDILEPRSTLKGNYEPTTTSHLYQSEIQYTCGLGRGFSVESPGEIPDAARKFSCTDNGTWNNDPHTADACVWTRCIHPPNPPPGSQVRLLHYMGEPVDENTTFLFYTNVTYHCFNGRKFVQDFYQSEVQARCLPGNIWMAPDDWGQCEETVTCSGLEPAPIGGNAIVIKHGSRFGPICDGPGYFQKSLSACPKVSIEPVSNSTGRAKFNLIFNNSEVLVVKNIFITCRFTSAPLKVTLPLGRVIATRSANVFGLDLKANLGPYDITSLRLEVEFNPAYTSICIESLECQTCNSGYSCLILKDEYLGNLSQQTFFDRTLEYQYETQIAYDCGPGRAFNMTHHLLDTQTLTCQWDGTWVPSSSIGNCVWTHCLKPPVPRNGSNLEVVNWDGRPIEFHSELEYRCQRGAKFQDEFHQDSVKVTCRPENTWEIPKPEWPQCVETKFCPQPPSPPVNGSILIRNNGLLFGHVCQGSNGSFVPMIGSGCNNPEIRLRSTYEQGYFPNKRTYYSYDIKVRSVKPGEWIASWLIFSQPVSTSSVKISSQFANQLKETSSQNMLYFEVELSPYASNADNLIVIIISTESGAQVPCLISHTCSVCEQKAECSLTEKRFKEDVYDHQSLTKFGTILEYECGLGRAFKVDNVSTIPSQAIECEWNGTWSPTNQIYPCHWVACIHPPKPLTRYNLVVDYVEGSVVDFGDFVYYRCRDGFYFAEDFYLDNFTSICFSNGTWSSPRWKGCLDPLTRYCPDPPDTSKNGGNSDWNPVLTGKTPFNAVVRYSCQTARKLQRNLSNGTTELYEEQELRCEWNQTWSPSSQIDKCIWYQCIDPPTPSGRDLIPLWNGYPLEFNETVEYACAHEGLWFENDYEQKSFDVKCLEDGSFDQPEDWPYCVRTVFCGTPPSKPRGGTWIWNGETSYGTEIEYTCGQYAQFFNPMSNASYDIKRIQCLWSKKWSQETLDPCVWSSCNLIPEPPEWTKLKYVPHPSLSLPIQSEHATYAPTIPFLLKAAHEFGRGQALLVDGFMLDQVDQNHLPTFEFFDFNDSVVLKIELEPSYANMIIHSDLRPTTEAQTSVVVDYGKPFFMNVEYVPNQFHFRIEFNGELAYVFNLPGDIPDLEFREIRAQGDQSITFIGFAPPGTNPAVPVGTEIWFRCPEFHVFSHDWYHNPHVRITCQENGLFSLPEIWPECVYPATTEPGWTDGESNGCNGTHCGNSYPGETT